MYDDEFKAPTQPQGNSKGHPEEEDPMNDPIWNLVDKAMGKPASQKEEEVLLATRSRTHEAPPFFTSRVMRQIEALPSPSRHPSQTPWWIPRLSFRWLASAGAACALVVLAYLNPHAFIAGESTPRSMQASQNSQNPGLNSVSNSASNPGTQMAMATPSLTPSGSVANAEEISRDDAEVVEMLDELIAYEDNSAWLNPAAM